jgi:hypothetical protein
MRIAKTPMESVFYACRAMRVCVTRTRKCSLLLRVNKRENEGAVSLLQNSKFFFHNAEILRLPRSDSIKNERIACRPIRVRDRSRCADVDA